MALTIGGKTMEYMTDNYRYLGQCHAYGWEPTDQGLEAFKDQIMSGFRGLDGRIRWEDFKIGMEKSV